MTTRNLPVLSDVADEILKSLLATPTRQRRLLSSTFWDKFEFKVRSRERVEAVRTALTERHVRIVKPEAQQFGQEAREDWIVLTFDEEGPEGSSQGEAVSSVPPPARPPDPWFETLRTRLFESEQEVEHYFVLPLLEALGYTEEDIALGMTVEMYEGVKRVRKEADVVVFDGTTHTKENTLLIIETKGMEKPISDSAVQQARSYALWLSPPFYLVTNGDDLRLYRFRGAVQPDVAVLTTSRADLRVHWDDLATTLHRGAVVARKARDRRDTG